MATEELFVNAFDDDKTAWTEYAPSPYLNDSMDNYIRTSTVGAEEGDFDFADSAIGEGIINSVKLKIYAKRADIANLFHIAYVRIYVWDGSSWVNAGDIILTTAEQWYEKDISAIIDSWVKIDGCRLYVKAQVCTSAWQCIYKAKLVIDYTPIVPPPPVTTEQWPYYMAFAKRAYKFHYNFNQPTASNEVDQLIDEFEERGLNREVLEQLAVIAKTKGELAKQES